MRVIVAGGREFDDEQRLHNVLSLLTNEYGFSQVVCGMARGVDMFGKHWADLNNLPVVEFPANWNRYGKSAGYKRNLEMAENADMLIAVWDGKSKGTGHMIDIAKTKGLKVIILRY